MKAIIVNGCKDCPYAMCESRSWGIYTCDHSNIALMNDPNGTLPETPHPNCKLNNLPSDQTIREYSDYNTGTFVTEGAFIEGANYILTEITK